MSLFGVWDEHMNEFERAVAAARKAPRDVARQEVMNAMGENGSLTRNAALRISEETGWATRTLWRWATEIRNAQLSPARGEKAAAHPASPAYATFLEALQTDGPAGFRFDELAMTMLCLCGGNMRRFHHEVVSAGYPMPSLPTLSRRWREVPLPIRDGIRNGHRNRFSNLLYVRRSPAAAANLVWQIDDFDLDVRVLTEAADDEVAVVRDGRWIGRRPHLILLIDEHSRFITGWVLLDRVPVSDDVRTLFADAFEVRDAESGAGVVGGLCQQVVCDNAAIFTSFATEDLFAELAVDVKPAPAYSPISKAIVERVGQTIQANLITGLSGVVTRATRVDGSHLFDTPAETWLEFAVLEAVCARVIHDYNYNRRHTSLKGRTPASAYVKSNQMPRVVPDASLASMYMPVRHAGGERIVQHTGVQALGHWWMDPALANLIGSTVKLRQLHHRLDQIAVFDGADRFVCLARRSDLLDAADANELVEQRIVANQMINRYSARAREAMLLNNAAVSSGSAPDIVTAAVTAIDNRHARSATVPRPLTLDDTYPDGTPRGPQPTSRRPRSKATTAKTPSPRRRNQTALDVAEAALTAKSKSKSSGRMSK